MDFDGVCAFIRRLNKKTKQYKYHRKKVYMYNLDNELVRVFNTTEECGDYFGYDKAYLYHNLKYCKKIRHKKERKWYIIRREEINGEV